MQSISSAQVIPAKKGVLLLNLGSPASPSVKDVRTYLNEFLNDPHVIDLPWVFRKILVNGIILNTRPKNSAEAYQKIWEKDGSPLLRNTRNLTAKVSQLINATAGEESTSVKMAMRYGTPSLKTVLEEFRAENVSEIAFIPLYPQYSYAASESSIVEFERLHRKIFPELKVDIIEDFFAEPDFISALANSMREAIDRVKPDLLLLSYHGIPERQIAKTKAPPAVCCSPGCCDQWNSQNEKCYRAQCFETSRLLSQKLGLGADQVVTSFQSRLGRTKWIEPYTDILLPEFVKKGKKRILVASPSFTSDCLETLEEIQLRYQEVFMAAGGESFEYLPCLNDRDDFAFFVAKLAQKTIKA
ncbi:MAG: ferrochelatase [Bdellovibrionales bacterium]|nr:ferrochelatase [Oligoflexia bacterium]